ncbi:MAG TPA: 3-isopropylmalate dehydrogenase, partial [Bacteroidota bacterium]|nr:3-isopropylmalate dehydrogenase [Bacteroidota bacterium]
MNATIVVLPGDGIGPEVTAEAVAALRAIADRFGHRFAFTEHRFGGASIDLYGVPVTDEVLAACTGSAAVLLGAVGGPRWDSVEPAVRPEAGLLKLRKHLGVFANLRPVRPHPALTSASPLKEHLLNGVDLLVVRELTGGLYFGTPRGTREEQGIAHATDTLSYSSTEIARVVRLAFTLAGTRRKKVTSVDKANVLESSRLWRKTASEIAKEFPGVALNHMLVDTTAMRIVTSPASFDVVVTENMFGDILTDEASVLAGSLGLLPSASLGDGGPGLYEPIHGSAPDIAGRGIANPIGTLLSAAMLLRYSLGLEDEAALL